MSPDPALWPALAVAGYGAFLDVRERRLPNWLCALLAIAALGGTAYSAGASLLPWTLLHAAISLAVGMILFSVGAIGGGDAKFYAAAASAVPVNNALPMLGWTSATGLLLLVVMAFGRRVRRDARRTPLFRGWTVPYGAAIFAGFGLTLFRA